MEMSSNVYQQLLWRGPGDGPLRFIKVPMSYAMEMSSNVYQHLLWRVPGDGPLRFIKSSSVVCYGNVI